MARRRPRRPRTIERVARGLRRAGGSQDRILVRVRELFPGRTVTRHDLAMILRHGGQ